MRKIRHAIVAMLFCAALVSTTVATAAGPPTIQRWVVAGGGGQATSRVLLLRATAGQSVAGLSQTRTRTLCAGFWCAGLPVELPQPSLYLPLVLRS